MLGRSGWVAALGGWLLFGVGCGGGSPAFEELERDPSFPGTPGERSQYDALFETSGGSQCPVSNPRDLGLESELRVFRGKGIDDRDVQRYLGALQRYWASYGVDCFTRHEIIEVPFTYALTLRDKKLAKRIQDETGLDPNDPLSGEDFARVEIAATRAILHNMIEIIDVYSTPPTPTVNLVLLKRIVETEGLGLRIFEGRVAGVGISPALLDNDPEGEPLLQILAEAGVPTEFTPLAIVGIDTTDSVLEEPDALIAHEVGHAYGLPHVSLSNNLMFPTQVGSCGGDINDEQIGIVERSLGPAARVLPAERILSLSHRWPDLLRFSRASTSARP